MLGFNYFNYFMHLPTLYRKLFFILTGNLYLADTIRNFTYNWVWKNIKNLKKGSQILDIGSRDSLFPFFLSWRGFSVTIVERDERFIKKQIALSKRWNTSIKIENCDFLSFLTSQKYDVICSLFSLQHSGDSDVNAYSQIGDFLKNEGLFFSATEYNSQKTLFQKNRDDGEMRIYSREDIEERIKTPLNKREIIEQKRCYLKVSRKKVITLSSEAEATIILMMFKKLSLILNPLGKEVMVDKRSAF